MLLNVANLTKAYGPDEILMGVTFRMERREKVAIVGRNGTGKTTLLKILNSELEADTGAVQLSRGATIGYLKQHDPIDLSGTVREEAEKALQHAIHVKRRLEELEVRLLNNPSNEELEEYTTVHEHYLELEGYAAERDLQTVLNKMGFKDEDFDKPASALSGGERTRLALARQILEEPDLLILDEPTNHLDLQAAEWLEGWLKNYPGAVLIVSHDRAFLENIGDRFLELKDGKVKSYPGPFAKFRKLRAEEDIRLAEVAKRQDQQLAKLDEFVRRFMNSQRTAQARGRQKHMNKLAAQKVIAPTAEKGVKGNLSPTKRSGDKVIEAKKISVSFGARKLIENLDWTVSIGQRWGVIGDNGTGKSTLIRVLLGLREANSGTAEFGANIEVGYFSQDAEDLDLEKSPIEFLVYECDMTPQTARDLLGNFLITGDDVFRPTKTLSGGEKNKLSLARLVQMKPNLLVLDEPTNHLDMDSREALASMLKSYKGTLVLVSHDRWLLGEVTNHTLHLRKDGLPISYAGNYARYRGDGVKVLRSKGGKGSEVLRLESADQQTNIIAEKEPQNLKTVESQDRSKLSPREVSKEISRLEKSILDSETSISETESEITVLERELSKVAPHADVWEMSQRHSAEKERLEGQMSAWEEQTTRLEELRKMQ